MTRAERLARALWNQERAEMSRATGSECPAFFNYADGEGEPMPWQHQKRDLHEYFLKRARKLLRAIGPGGAPT